MTLIDSRLSHIRTQPNNPIMVPKLIVFLAICLAVHSFSPPHPKIQTQLHAQPDDGPVFYNDFEDSGFGTDDLDLSHMLKQRSMEINREERRILKNWRYGEAHITLICFMFTGLIIIIPSLYHIHSPFLFT